MNEYLAPAAISLFLFREILDLVKGRAKVATDQISEMRRELDRIAVHIENFRATLLLTQKTATDLNVAFERLRNLEAQTAQSARSRES